MSDYKSPIKFKNQLSKEMLAEFSEAMKNMGDSFKAITVSFKDMKFTKFRQRLPRKLKKRLSKA